MEKKLAPAIFLCYYVSGNRIVTVRQAKPKLFVSYFLRKVLVFFFYTWMGRIGLKIEKIYNNNVVLSHKEGKEIVVMGRGIAFQKKVGNEIAEEYVEKTFVMKNDTKLQEQLADVFADIPEEELEVSKKIIEIAEKELQTELDVNIYLMLTDHIHYAIERYHQGINLTNPLVFEIKRFYGQEFQLAKRALEMIEKQFAIVLPEDEAGFIALHIVNARQKDSDMHTTIESTRMVRDVLSIISKFFGLVFDENSVSYNRIVTHLHYFFQRMLVGELKEESDDFLYEIVKEKYPKAFECSTRIKSYVEKTGQSILTRSELVYLTIHIQRVTDDK